MVKVDGDDQFDIEDIKKIILKLETKNMISLNQIDFGVVELLETYQK